MGRGACYRLWTGDHFEIYTNKNKDQPVSNWKKELRQAEQSSNKEKAQELFQEWFGTGKGGHFRVNGVGKFMKNVGECIKEEQSKVSIPTVAGAATGAATLGIAGGGLGIYFLPKLIKCFV